MNSWCVTDVVSLCVSDQKLVAEKPVQGGSANASFSFSASPSVVTIRRGVGSVPEKNESAQGEITEYKTPEIDSRNNWEVVDSIKRGKQRD